MTDHAWRPCDPPGVKAARLKAPAFGTVVTHEPDDERRWFHCPRCGATYSKAGFGPLTRREVDIRGNPVGKPREITGWETQEQGMKRCEVDPDCDVQAAASVMES